ncbi:hypothetical protein ACU8KH_01616 [Lachancea thermotolerans]
MKPFHAITSIYTNHIPGKPEPKESLAVFAFTKLPQNLGLQPYNTVLSKALFGDLSGDAKLQLQRPNKGDLEEIEKV